MIQRPDSELEFQGACASWLRRTWPNGQAAKSCCGGGGDATVAATPFALSGRFPTYACKYLSKRLLEWLTDTPRGQDPRPSSHWKKK